MTFALNNVQMSFRDALAEVCALNRFPLRQRRMEGALKRDYTMERLESEVGCFGLWVICSSNLIFPCVCMLTSFHLFLLQYHTCTAKVPPGASSCVFFVCGLQV